MKSKTILTVAFLLVTATPGFAGALGSTNLKNADGLSLCKEDPALCDLVEPEEELNPNVVDLAIVYSPKDSADQRLAAVKEVGTQAADLTKRQLVELNLIIRNDPDWRVVDAAAKIRFEQPSYFKSLLREKLDALFSESAKTKMFWIPSMFTERGRFIKAVSENPRLQKKIENLWLFEKNKSAKVLLLEIGSKEVYVTLAPHPLSREFIPQERAGKTGWWPYTGKRCEMLLKQK